MAGIENKSKIIEHLKRLQEESIGLHELVEMTEVDGTPIRDEDGIQVVNDVLVIGDGRLYIERAYDEPDSEQDLIDLLKNLEDYIPIILEALQS